MTFWSGSAVAQEKGPKQALGTEDPLQKPGANIAVQETHLAVLQEAAKVERPRSISVLSQAERYYQEGKYALAEPLYLRTLARAEETLEPGHPELAAFMSKLTRLYCALGKYAKAEALGQRALAIWEKSLGPDHPEVAIGLNNLGMIYYHQGNYQRISGFPLKRAALRRL